RTSSKLNISPHSGHSIKRTRSAVGSFSYSSAVIVFPLDTWLKAQSVASLTKTVHRFAGSSDFDITCGGSLSWVSAVDPEGRTIWIVDAHRDNGRRFVVRTDDKFTAS